MTLNCIGILRSVEMSGILALTSPTGGGRSVGIVRSRTKATEFSLVLEMSGPVNSTKQCKAQTDWNPEHHA